MAILQKLNNDGHTIILVTHEMGFARRIADHVALLADGAIVETGSVAEVFDRPQTARSREFLARVLKY